ncbi:hypothetical protein PsYK624_121610 [Phanerochaete sordida]|uniref:Uncharacterized protein n=1 Tax=Phanerochaete sordida TaxID=48140 RepID=A0A9P3LIB7_9APHY|nr:hypothetical protein PsYK624_121610 [Phanerochaete sordida]
MSASGESVRRLLGPACVLVLSGPSIRFNPLLDIIPASQLHKNRRHPVDVKGGSTDCATTSTSSLIMIRGLAARHLPALTT